MVATSYKRPGTYLTEVLAPAIVTQGSSLSTAVILGTHNRGPVAPTHITSWSQFARLYGDFVPGVAPSDLQLAVYLFFQNGGGNVYVQRVLAGSEATATASLLDREGSAQATLTLNAVNPGIWGNSISYGIADSGITGYFDLYVFYGGAQQERFAGLSIDPTNPQYVLNVVNSPTQGSRFVTAVRPTLTGSPSLSNQIPALTGSGSPFVLAPVALASGADQAAAPVLANWTAALALCDTIGNPLTLNLAGQIGSTFVNAAIAWCEARGDSFLVIDPITTVSGTAPTAAAQVTAAASFVGANGSSSYSGLYYPRLVIADPSSASQGATRVVCPGGAVLGRFSAVDAAVGVQQSPAGEIYGRLSNVLGTEVPISDTDADTLNPLGINAIRIRAGVGVCLFGARTLRQTGQADRYISVRRTLIYVKALLAAVTAFALFEPNDSQLWQQIDAVCESALTTFWQAHGLKGASASDAFSVQCDEVNNTTQTVASGELHIDAGVSPLTPAEFIGIQVSQYNGSVTVTDSLG
jgi:hypothetical protein